MVRQVRHYLGAVGLLYYLEPKLTRRRRSPKNTEAFREAIACAFDEEKFVHLVRDRFAYASRIQVYLAPHAQRLNEIEYTLIRKWSNEYPEGLQNIRGKRARKRLTLLNIQHAPQDPPWMAGNT